MIGHNPQFTYRKDRVFCFFRRIPKDIRHQYEHDKFVMCPGTKNRVVAGTSAGAPAPLRPGVTEPQSQYNPA